MIPKDLDFGFDWLWFKLKSTWLVMAVNNIAVNFRMHAWPNPMIKMDIKYLRWLKHHKKGGSLRSSFTCGLSQVRLQCPGSILKAESNITNIWFKWKIRSFADPQIFTNKGLNLPSWSVHRCFPKIITFEAPEVCVYGLMKGRFAAITSTGFKTGKNKDWGSDNGSSVWFQQLAAPL